MKFQQASVLLAVAMVVGCALSNGAQAANFSFTGNFQQDDDVQTFSFSVGAPSAVTLRTWSYAGGSNAAGDLIDRGGFDPILALFNSSGDLINQNDDGGSNVPADSVTSQHYDTFLQAVLAPGTYTVSVMEFDNFAVGPNFSNGFVRDGQGNFTTGPFIDVTGDHRDNHWAFDILNVESAVVNAVPEPASLIVWSVLGIAGIVAYRRRKAA